MTAQAKQLVELVQKYCQTDGTIEYNTPEYEQFCNDESNRNELFILACDIIKQEKQRETTQYDISNWMRWVSAFEKQYHVNLQELTSVILSPGARFSESDEFVEILTKLFAMDREFFIEYAVQLLQDEIAAHSEERLVHLVLKSTRTNSEYMTVMKAAQELISDTDLVYMSSMPETFILALDFLNYLDNVVSDSESKASVAMFVIERAPEQHRPEILKRIINWCPDASMLCACCGSLVVYPNIRAMAMEQLEKNDLFQEFEEVVARPQQCSEKMMNCMQSLAVCRALDANMVRQLIQNYCKEITNSDITQAVPNLCYMYDDCLTHEQAVTLFAKFTVYNVEEAIMFAKYIPDMKVDDLSSKISDFVGDMGIFLNANLTTIILLSARIKCYISLLWKNFEEVNLDFFKMIMDYIKHPSREHTYYFASFLHWLRLHHDAVWNDCQFGKQDWTLVLNKLSPFRGNAAAHGFCDLRFV